MPSSESTVSSTPSTTPTTPPPRVDFKLKLAPAGPTRVLTFSERPAWDTLLTRVGATFNVDKDAISFFYVDSDGDNITLCTDEELVQRCSELPAGDPVRFTVHIASDPTEHNPGAPSEAARLKEVEAASERSTTISSVNSEDLRSLSLNEESNAAPEHRTPDFDEPDQNDRRGWGHGPPHHRGPRHWDGFGPFGIEDAHMYPGMPPPPHGPPPHHGPPHHRPPHHDHSPHHGPSRHHGPPPPHHGPPHHGPPHHWRPPHYGPPHHRHWRGKHHYPHHPFGHHGPHHRGGWDWRHHGPPPFPYEGHEGPHPPPMSPSEREREDSGPSHRPQGGPEGGTDTLPDAALSQANRGDGDHSPAHGSGTDEPRSLHPGDRGHGHPSEPHDERARHQEHAAHLPAHQRPGGHEYSQHRDDPGSRFGWEYGPYRGGGPWNRPRGPPEHRSPRGHHGQEDDRGLSGEAWDRDSIGYDGRRGWRPCPHGYSRQEGWEGTSRHADPGFAMVEERQTSVEALQDQQRQVSEPPTIERAEKESENGYEVVYPPSASS